MSHLHSEELLPTTGQQALDEVAKILDKHGYLARNSDKDGSIWESEEGEYPFLLEPLSNGAHGFTLTHPRIQEACWNCGRCFIGIHELPPRKFFAELSQLVALMADFSVTDGEETKKIIN